MASGPTARDAARGIINIGIGTAKYLVRRRREPFATRGLIPLHARTNGRGSWAVARLLRTLEYPMDRRRWGAPAQTTTVITADAASTVAIVDRDGVAVVPGAVPTSICDAIAEEARMVESRYFDEDGNSGVGRYHDGGPPGSRFGPTTEWVLANPYVQSMLADPFMLDTAHAYLRSVPVLASVGMWWSIARDEGASSYLAQKFHWDMTGMQWVKFFVYLTDVDARSGPHVFVKGSHRPCPESRELLRRGAIRIDDADIVGAFGSNRVCHIEGERGTMLVADTRGFHKGEPPRDRDRLMLEFIFNSSMLGTDREDLPITDPSPDLRAAIEARPRTFAWATVR